MKKAWFLIVTIGLGLLLIIAGFYVIETASPELATRSISTPLVSATNTLFVPANTSTPMPTNTPPPTSTPAPTDTPTTTPTPMPDAIVVVPYLAVYSGPGIEYEKIASIPRGAELTVIGQTYGCDWLEISLPNGTTGWVWIYYEHYTIAFDLGLACEGITESVIPPTPTLSPPRRLENGTIIKGIPSVGSNKLIIENGRELDGVVTLVRSVDQANWVTFAFYVQAKSKFELNGISNNRYQLLFILGEDWDEESGLFTRNAEYYKFEQQFVYDAEWPDSYEYTLTLHTVKEGNAPLDYLDPSSFPNLGK